MTSERDHAIVRLTMFPGRLAEVARAVAAADDAAGGPPSGEWTARQNVAHLVAVERAVWHARLDGLAALPPGEEPAWSRVEPSPVEEPDTATLESALALFARERTATMARLDTLDEAGWARTGVHASYGRLDVAGLLGVAAGHDDEHITTMTAGRRLAGGDRA
jgi:hypothetical protein